MAHDARRSGRVESDDSYRSPYLRDRDRVLYSEPFRRLAGVTQVASGAPGVSLHNRLTHSLKVEQVAISLASRLNHDQGQSVDYQAVATAGLAHDIGHPPFGHAGEQALDALVVCPTHRQQPRPIAQRRQNPCGDCLLEDGFEGNAQTFRILTALATRRSATDSAEVWGLDLTKLSLSATTKYPWTRGETGTKPNKWGAYDCDADALSWTTDDSTAQTLEASIMDWADDISYAVHDIEDFYRTGQIPLHQIRPGRRGQPGSQGLTEFLDYVAGFRKLAPATLTALKGLLAFTPTRRFAGRADDIQQLDYARRVMITRFINAATVSDSQLSLDVTTKELNWLLKQLIWYHVIDDPQLTTIQLGQKQVLGDIWRAWKQTALDAYGAALNKDVNERELRRLPHELRRAIEVGLQQDYNGYTLTQKVYRGLLDYIASLSDSEAYFQHTVISGRESAGYLR